MSATPLIPKTVSLILAGAASRGAYEAGVLQVIADRAIPVRRIVGASAGALNAAVYATGVRARREREIAHDLVELWRVRGDWGHGAHVSLRDLVSGSGVSDSKGMLELLHSITCPCQATDPASVDLRIVVSPLRGIEGDFGTTYEHVLHFRDATFDNAGGLEAVINAAVASASIPVVFAPVELPGVGPCLDGGMVNNAPISYALSDDLEDEAVIVVSPMPEVMPASSAPMAGVELLSRTVDALTNERIYRDLRRAEQINEQLLLLDELAEARSWSPDDLRAFKSAVGLAKKKRVQIVQIRPTEPLAGNALSGFSSRDARVSYIKAGQERAATVLDELGWR